MPKTTKHHPVPESLLGDYSHAISEDDHDAYHRACSFYSPDMVLRRLAYGGFRRNGGSLPVDVSRQILELLSPKNWRDLYKPGTFCSEEQLRRDNKGDERQAIAAYHLRNFFDDEQLQITHATGRVSGFSDPNGDVRHMHVFFRTNKPALAMHRMVSERQGKQVRKWVQPMHTDIAEELESLTSDVEVERLTRAGRREAINLLERHHGYIAKYQRDVRHLMQKHVAVLSKMGARKSSVDVKKFD